jgi:hypothetical protein
MTGILAAEASDRGRQFHQIMGMVCLVVSAFGFVPTFFIPLVQGTLHGPPIYYVHAALFLAWLVFLVSQARLATSGRVAAHREWGVLGAALATSMVFSVFALVVIQLNRVPATSAPPLPLPWEDVWVNLFFATCVAAALANTRRSDRHRRLLLLGTITLLFPALGRWVTVWAPGILRSPPDFTPTELVIVLVLTFVPALLIVTAMAVDRNPRGRLSRIYIVGLMAYVVLVFTQTRIGNSGLWFSVANRLRHIPG